MGLSYTGMICFDIAFVSGYSLVPDPPARIIPFIGSFSFSKAAVAGRILPRYRPLYISS